MRDKFNQTKTINIAEFNSSELEQLITESTGSSLKGNALLTRFEEYVTPDKLTQSTNAMRRKIQDHLGDNYEQFGRGSGESIQVILFALIYHEPTNTVSTGSSGTTSHESNPSLISSSNKGYLFGAHRQESEIYQGYYPGTILSATHRKIRQLLQSSRPPRGPTTLGTTLNVQWRC